jgi:uncharacterized membrane protein
MPLALAWYEWFKTGHVLAAVLWVGGGATLAVYAILTQRQNTPEEMASVARKAALIGERMFTPLSLLTLAFGFGLMENAQSPWTYDQFFVIFALAGWGVSAATGAFFLGPEAKKLGKADADEAGRRSRGAGPDPPDPVDRPDRRGRAARGRLCDDREAVPLAHKADELLRP